MVNNYQNRNIKKIAFLVTGLNSGGIENYLLRFLNHYKEEIDATIYCKGGYTGDLEKEYLELGIKLKIFSLGFFNIYQYIKLYGELKKNKYDSVCDFTGNFAALTLFVAKMVNVNKRIVFYRSSSNRFKESFLRLAYNKTINYIIRYSATNILANSQAALNFFFKDYWENNEKFEVIYNGINAKKFKKNNSDLRSSLGFMADDFVIGHIGRFNEAKNHKVLIEVAINLCAKYKDIKFIFVGSGVDTAYSERIKKEDLNDQIKLFGYRSNINEILNTLDCFFFPSLTEGQPNALIEALICGLPFVSSNIDPIKETIPVEYYSQLVPPDDSSLAIEKLLAIKDNFVLRKHLNLSSWAEDYYKPEIWFAKFFDKL